MILVEGVSKSYGSVKAIEKISFEVALGTTVVILGPSGSGKTTLLRLIAGLEIPDEGQISMNGSVVSRKGWSLPPYQRHLGFVFQVPALWPHMTVTKNIEFGLANWTKTDRRARLNEVLSRTALINLANRYPDQLSGGEARRVALARAIAPRYKYLLMDEPLTNLDGESKNKLLNLIKEISSQEGVCLLYVTHDHNEARAISSRVLLLDNGRLKVQDK